LDLVKSQTRPSGAQQIKVLRKAFEILEVLHAGEREGIRLSTLSDEARLPRPTVFRILRTLESMGYVTFDRARESYTISGRLTDLGQPSTEATFTRLARPAMLRLLASFEQTVNMAVLEKDTVIKKDLIEGLRSVRVKTVAGLAISPTKTALGKAILAYLPAERIPALIRAMHKGHGHEESRATLDRLSEEFEEIRRVGFAIDNEETEKGLRCVGAPVFDKSGAPFGALSVSGSNSTVNQEMIATIGRQVRKECDEISFALGYLPPRPD
jgi:IclR family acetate operon transcriptional repressor